MEIKKIIRSIFFTALYYTGIGIIIKKRNQRKWKIPILLFHRVSNIPDPYWHALTIKEFEKIISFFNKQYKFRPLADLFQSKPEDLQKSCFIVFDDAFTDFRLNALPVLKKYNVPSTMFVPVKCVEEKKPIWPTFLNIVISNTKKRQVDFKIKGQQKIFQLGSIKEKIKAANIIEAQLRKLPYREFIAKYHEVINQLEPCPLSTDITIMSWEEIKEILADVDFQSHTMTHPMLGNIENIEDLEYEIGESKKILEEILGKEVNYISYPIGSYTLEVITYSSNNYKGGFAVDNRLVDIHCFKKEQYRFRIPRFNVSDTNSYELFFRINGFHKLFGR